MPRSSRIARLSRLRRCEVARVRALDRSRAGEAAWRCFTRSIHRFYFAQRPAWICRALDRGRRGRGFREETLACRRRAGADGRIDKHIALVLRAARARKPLAHFICLDTSSERHPGDAGYRLWRRRRRADRKDENPLNVKPRSCMPRSMATGATYEVPPMFSDNRGAGYTFNDAETAERVTVTTPTGRVEIRRAAMLQSSTGLCSSTAVLLSSSAAPPS
jgi:hypothetical protein